VQDLALERKKLMICEQVKIVQHVERNPIVPQIESMKCLRLPPSSVLQKASILKDEGQCGTDSNKRKKYED
jgi:hypothetical protein